MVATGNGIRGNRERNWMKRKDVIGRTVFDIFEHKAYLGIADDEHRRACSSIARHMV